MKIITTIRQMRRYVHAARRQGKTIGFVPTMGYLHAGHLSLVHAACRENDLVVMSIFVNPLQFGKHEDLGNYPRDLKRDRALARTAGVDCIFFPSVREMYPPRFATHVAVDGLTETLCGRSRPGHFRGVTTVVTKLFNIVAPTRAYFGHKDAQQAAVIARMAQDLDMDLTVKVLPTVREPDGLAMSSRNAYLSARERRDALVLNRALRYARHLVDAGERRSVRIVRAVKAMIRRTPTARIDYVAVVDPLTMQPVTLIRDGALIACAVHIGRTRLIDNTEL